LIVRFSNGSSSLDFATAMRMRSFAFFVAASASCMWIHEHWSRMLAISNRYGLSPASLIVFWNSGSCVLGVQLATTTRLRLCSLIISLIFSCVSCEQV
jgi:hypothetical protein